MNPTLYALVINLTAENTTTLRATQGHLAHAAFLDILRQVDPALSQTLHDKNGRKPFTLSPLHGFGHGRKGELHIRAGQTGWLRVTLLDPTLFHTFIRYFLQGNVATTISLQNAAFAVTDILSTPGSHALAGYDSLARLHDHWQQIDPTARQHRRIRLVFRSPTAFSLKQAAFRTMYVLPDPALVFGELARYWDRLTGSNTMATMRDFAPAGIVVARHHIRTHMYRFRKSKQVGFSGDVTFKILDKDHPELICHANRLADLAFYTGLGYKTTMGMGQVSRVMNGE